MTKQTEYSMMARQSPRAHEKEVTKLRRELAQAWKDIETLPITEIGARNPGVLEYMRHWEERASKAEALVEPDDRLNAVYQERNQLVALLSTVYPSVKCKTAIEGWDEAWHGCVYICAPWGQASWHYHTDDAWMFAHLPESNVQWDGHTTDEKYASMAAFVANQVRDATKMVEPVAWMCAKADLIHKGYSRFSRNCEGDWNIPVYTSPPQRPWVNLTPEEILDTFDKHNVYGSKWVEFARTIEAKLRSKNP